MLYKSVKIDKVSWVVECEPVITRSKVVLYDVEITTHIFNCMPAFDEMSIFRLRSKILRWNKKKRKRVGSRELTTTCFTLISCLSYYWTWILRREVTPKCRLTFNRTRGVITQRRIRIFIMTSLGTSNLTNLKTTKLLTNSKRSKLSHQLTAGRLRNNNRVTQISGIDTCVIKQAISLVISRG
jgi:hypothetical protein